MVLSPGEILCFPQKYKLTKQATVSRWKIFKAARLADPRVAAPPPLHGLRGQLYNPGRNVFQTIPASLFSLSEIILSRTDINNIATGLRSLQNDLWDCHRLRKLPVEQRSSGTIDMREAKLQLSSDSWTSLLGVRQNTYSSMTNCSRSVVVAPYIKHSDWKKHAVSRRPIRNSVLIEVGEYGRPRIHKHIEYGDDACHKFVIWLWSRAAAQLAVKFDVYTVCGTYLQRASSADV